MQFKHLNNLIPSSLNGSLLNARDGFRLVDSMPHWTVEKLLPFLVVEFILYLNHRKETTRLVCTLADFPGKIEAHLWLDYNPADYNFFRRLQFVTIIFVICQKRLLPDRFVYYLFKYTLFYNIQSVSRRILGRDSTFY